MNNYSVFGFGRRLCPGAHIAERSLNIIVSRVGWAYKIRKAVDPTTGREIVPPEYDCKHFRFYLFSSTSHQLTMALDVNGLNTEPHHFQFELASRSPERDAIIEQEAERATEELRQPAA